ncbi:tripartite motif-containing protein 60 [Octodon degus]|uniref:Tripartite motif-containing protein 60 n=1 Tax=Octodon degus TaxID=10160 RepID=A0A6P3ES32_OCTDE|nr:tripartite motif-containing protein 60 [Octodon degus]
MALSGTLTSLQEESCCPVCFDYFKDPVTTGCGHNFCCDCLSSCWEGLPEDGTFPCPVCRFGLPRTNVYRNLQLGSLAQAAQQLEVRRSRRKRLSEHSVCELHQQALTQFCQNDLELLCTRCSFAPKHLKHHVSSIEEAALQQRRQLERSVEPLRSDLEQMERLIELQSTKTLELRKAAAARREEIEAEYEQLRQFLQEEHHATLLRMGEEEAEILGELKQHLASFFNYTSGLKGLLKEVEAKSAFPDLALLRALKGIEEERQQLRRPEPSAVELSGYELRIPAQLSGLERLVQHFQIDMLFDPSTAHPQLILSSDRKIAHFEAIPRRVCHTPRRFYLCPAVLGQQCFDSGRHYWEVEVGTKPKWALGACQGSLPRNWRNKPDRRRGFWALGRCEDNGYLIFGAQKAQIVPKARPSKIGIFLDYELGEISFYNADDRSVLYTFHDCFTKTVWPYFFLGQDSKPLRLSSESERET